MGVIRSQNTNPRTRVANKVANFLVYYTMDKTTGIHALTPTTYNTFLLQTRCDLGERLEERVPK